MASVRMLQIGHLLQEINSPIPLYIHPLRCIIIMSVSQSGDNPSQEQGFDPQDFIDRPMIILSSSEEIQLPPESEPQKSTVAESQGLKVIQRKKETEQDRLRRLNSVKSIWEEAEEQQKKDLDDIRKNPPKKANLQALKARQSQLHKEFEGHRYLPMRVLEAAKDKLDEFKTHPKCKFEKTIKYTQSQIIIKQKNRQTLTKDIVLACEELRDSKEQKTDYEQKLLEKIDLLTYSYKIAAEIEENFYKKLYNKRSHKIGEAYTQQLKLIGSQFRDKNNLEFRRKVINQQFDLHDLANATQDTLTCEKTKREKQEKMKQLIRQNQKIAPQSPIQLQDEVIQAPIESIRSFSSMKSRSDMEEKPEQTKRRKQRDQQLRKNKKICKQTHQVISRHLKSMRQRTQRLRARLPIPPQLTFSFL